MTLAIYSKTSHGKVWYTEVLFFPFYRCGTEIERNEITCIKSYRKLLKGMGTRLPQFCLSTLITGHSSERPCW